MNNLSPFAPQSLRTYEKYTGLPLTVLSVVFLVAYSYSVLGPRDTAWHTTSDQVMNGIWVIYLFDYFTRFTLAQHKWEWFKHNLVDFFAVIVPLFRPLRALRAIKIITVMGKTATVTLRGKIFLYTLTTLALMVLVASLAILDAERIGGQADIDTFSEAVWWSFVTITTVGYGDLYPVTGTGKLVASFLMVGGVALIGVVTATISSWIVQTVSEREHEETESLHQQISALTEQVTALQASVSQLHDALHAGAAGAGSSAPRLGAPSAGAQRSDATAPVEPQPEG